MSSAKGRKVRDFVRKQRILLPVNAHRALLTHRQHHFGICCVPGPQMLRPTRNAVSREHGIHQEASLKSVSRALYEALSYLTFPQTHEPAVFRWCKESARLWTPTRNPKRAVRYRRAKHEEARVLWLSIPSEFPPEHKGRHGEACDLGLGPSALASVHRLHMGKQET